MTQAIVCYQEALRFWTAQTAPLAYAATLNNLGTAYCDLPTGDREENLKRAISCYQECLRFRKSSSVPLEYAMTQNNLGRAYSLLPTGDKEANLRRAISHYQEALRFRTPERAPYDYALTQSNLGSAYRDLPTGDRGANLTQAIACYQEALRFWTAEGAPFDYATTQHSLGEAYRKLPIGDRGKNLLQAIQCYQEALRFQTLETAPFLYAQTQNNLGIAHAELPLGNRGKNLQLAIQCYTNALHVLTFSAWPRDYAAIQNNLGAAYFYLPTKEVVEREANLVRAIECYQAALRVWSEDAAPLQYARTQNNLGNSYRDLSTGDKKSNQAKAIKCFNEARRFCTLQTSPHECRISNRNLAALYLDQADWQSAQAACQAAMDAGELLYRAGLSTENKAAEVAENVALYSDAAFATARLGKTAQAWLTLERGKTRLFAEALRLRVRRPAKVPDKAWHTFEQAAAVVRAVPSSYLPSNTHNPVEAYEARVQLAQQANAALDSAARSVRQYASEFLSEIDWPLMKALIPDQQTALIAFCITEHGSMSFICRDSVTKVEVPDFTTLALRELIQGPDEDPQWGGWIGGYRSRDDTRWHSTIEQVLAEVSENLLAPIIAALPEGIKRLILLPSGGLFLLPLHAAPLSDDGKIRLCDRYQVSYAPSAEVLADLQAKATRAAGNGLCAVINPEEDRKLLFTPAEGAALTTLFAEHQILMRRAGTKEAVMNGVRGRAYLHFSCHGTYNWDDPPASGLALADGHLTLAELQGGEVDMSAARLVTLSACETGMTDIIKGSPEEYVGLPAGFMLAGVPCVVASLWAVRDISTALLMERFYRNHLESGMDFVAALHEAQQWVRHLRIGEVASYAETCFQQTTWGNKAELFKHMNHYRYRAKQNPNERPFAHPYYWAAFTVNGM